jgi:hypothetical protein
LFFFLDSDGVHVHLVHLGGPLAALAAAPCGRQSRRRLLVLSLLLLQALVVELDADVLCAAHVARADLCGQLCGDAPLLAQVADGLRVEGDLHLPVGMRGREIHQVVDADEALLLVGQARLDLEMPLLVVVPDVHHAAPHVDLDDAAEVGLLVIQSRGHRLLLVDQAGLLALAQLCSVLLRHLCLLFALYWLLVARMLLKCLSLETRAWRLVD